MNGAVRVVPGTAEPERASFTRTARPAGGVTLRLAADPAVYLRHERGTLVTGGASAFLLS
ncbi:hypothetical protein ACIA8K_26105 [Catenuloplanes sp. NPDC051500]|uniref:hypothetical protein n=1 Tax=Catenuloplanes sp. NPDC051500 TaxID=3363959 RepID=UPI0037BD075A